MGLPLLILEASTESDLKKVFEVAAKEGIEALVVSTDGFSLVVARRLFNSPHSTNCQQSTERVSLSWQVV